MLHCTHFVGSHDGTNVAIPLFSNFVNETGISPPVWNVETGSSSPRKTDDG